MGAAALNSQLFVSPPRSRRLQGLRPAIGLQTDRVPRRSMRKPGNKYAHSAVSIIMDSRAQRYRECAVECERMASGVSDPSIKALYLDLAKQWRAMAEQADILDRERLKP
jgi:hypothetical protein